MKHRVVILGGGFAGVYTAIELEKTLARDPNVEITLVNRENFFLFTPMLHEVAAGDLDFTNIVNPIRRLLRRINFIEAKVTSIDIESRTVTLEHGFNSHEHVIKYDQLVLGLGSSTQFFGLPGVEQNAVTMKSLEDAVALRNRLIASLEEADSECSPEIRGPLLTFVVAGAGFAGIETIGSINDFVRNALKYYRNLRHEHVRFVVVHPGDIILPELDRRLGEYAQQKLIDRGVEVIAHGRVSSYDGNTVQLVGGPPIQAKTLIWTAGTMPDPLIAALPCAKEKGRILVTTAMCVPDFPGLWAVGDCAAVPDVHAEKPCPPTAQHALRQGRVVAQNITAYARGGSFTQFDFETIGQLATIGHRVGVANVLGFNFSGFVAWWMWRTIYLSKLPRLEKKVRVALDWTLDLFFSKDLCQFSESRGGERVPRKPSSSVLNATAQAAS